MRITLSSLAALAIAMPGLAMAQEADDGPTRQVEVVPYIEAAQVLTAELQPESDVVTYSRVAAGVEAYVNGRNNQASASVRYERRFGWDDDAADGDTISGLARGSAALVPQTLYVEAGGLATRSSVGAGGALLDGVPRDDSSTQVYSAYAGPTLMTRAGDVQVEAAYRFGYTRVETPNDVVADPAVGTADFFDESTVHHAQARIGTQPFDPLPVGVGIGGGYTQEDISNLDQRVRDAYARADVVVPVSRDFAVTGGIGYEDVEVSSRDAVRDPVTDQPIIGADGRFVTDDSVPRTIAYETDGLIWDVGAQWRPSRRTALSAYVGRRYGSTTYGGTLSYQPNPRTSINATVYDQVSGFGSQLTNALAALPAAFRVNRDAITGDVLGCVGTVETGSACFDNALGGVRSAAFRARGGTISFARNAGPTQWGIGAGYDRRSFIGAEGTILEAVDGSVDETLFAVAYLNRELDRRSGISTTAYATLFQSGYDDSGDATNIGASAGYYRDLAEGLAATAALGLNGQLRDEALDDIWTASALLGVRYSF